MRLTILLFLLSLVLKIASFTKKSFKKHIDKASVKFLIKTEDNRYGRLFIFDKGRVSSATGVYDDFDAALVWKDYKTGFSVLVRSSPEAVFNAAADGKLKVEGMSVYAQWFENAIKLAM